MPHSICFSRRGSTRERGVLLASGLVVVLALAACGSDGSDAGAGAGSGGGETTTVTDTMLGTVEGVPTEPQRVLALWRTGSELADLGVKPVGQLEGEFLEEELGPDLYADYDDVPAVGSTDGVDIEKVVELEPDLILGMDNGALSIDYDELSEVAPTVILDIAEPPDVWANYPRVAELVGASSDFEQQDATLEKSLASVEGEYGEAVGDADVTSIGVDALSDLYVDTSKSLAYERIDAAGFGYNPDYSDDPDRYVSELTRENLPDLADSDIIFYAVELDGEPSTETQAVLDLDSFQRLPAVEAGHAYPLTDGVIYTFAAAQQQVEDLRAAAKDYSETAATASAGS